MTTTYPSGKPLVLTCVRVTWSLVFCVVQIVVSPFVPFLLTMVFSVLLQFTTSDYLFWCLQTFFSIDKHLDDTGHRTLGIEAETTPFIEIKWKPKQKCNSVGTVPKPKRNIVERSTTHMTSIVFYCSFSYVVPLYPHLLY